MARVDMDKQIKVLEEATAGMTPEERREFKENFADYLAKREQQQRRKQGSGFKPINFNEVLGHIRKP